MFYSFRAASAIALAERRSFPWRSLLYRIVDRARTWLQRRRQRQELLDYLASDYRAAADIGITGCEARHLARRPFWRA